MAYHTVTFLFYTRRLLFGKDISKNIYKIIQKGYVFSRMIIYIITLKIE